MSIAELRKRYHDRVCMEIIRVKSSTDEDRGYPNFADGSNKASVKIAWGVAKRLRCVANLESLNGQTVGCRFEACTKDFLQEAFDLLHHLRPGEWHYATVQTEISRFDQYEHLAYLQRRVKMDDVMASTLGIDYIVTPDIVIGRAPVSDDRLNDSGRVEIVDADSSLARYTPLRSSNCQNPLMILHASVSCKWTIRSDRAQNTRTEALNLMRNRKGPLPHIVAVTAEPLPTRLATLALGTGDLDCVYHFALTELRETIDDIKNEDQLDMLNIMLNGKRLRDISDLPFDLAI